MASQNNNDMHEAKLAPSEDGQPKVRVQSDTLWDPHVALERHGDQAASQDPSPQDNLQPQDPNRGAANVEGNILLGLSFPRKFWRIVEDDAFTSVCWNVDGDTVIIEEDLFQREVLCRRGKEQIFESDSLKTFISLLNLHGFSKICPADSSVCSPGDNMMIYRHCNFQRDKPWLIENIKTKGNLMTHACPGTSTTLPKRKKKLAPTRHSPRIHHKNGTKEAEGKAQKKASRARGPSGTRSLKYSGLQSTSSAMEVQCPSEQGGPTGEGTSGNVMFVPTATAGTNGTRDLPTSPLNDPLYGSVMSLYNTCYSILMAGLSVMAPPEDPEEEGEEEDSSDNKCSLCEQFKDNAGP
ncbi:PREDICTED: heat shock transcription factor, X-linked-like [Miniopterus natalensis]|uniref:heat shock transcription factor, X-linked-like n=1 Tax=Miniopterus natalensis TaxID=291302 RepID=UPI0007A6C335|nr:PREDICTED: heat shock transcription factor, X-linked-like [Miniopterus natalensis]